MKPILCRLRAYCGPGLPRPTKSSMTLILACQRAGILRGLLLLLGLLTASFLLGGLLGTSFLLGGCCRCCFLARHSGDCAFGRSLLGDCRNLGGARGFG